MQFRFYTLLNSDLQWKISVPYERLTYSRTKPRFKINLTRKILRTV